MQIHNSKTLIIVTFLAELSSLIKDDEALMQQDSDWVS